MDFYRGQSQNGTRDNTAGSKSRKGEPNPGPVRGGPVRSGDRIEAHYGGKGGRFSDPGLVEDHGIK